MFVVILQIICCDINQFVEQGLLCCYYGGVVYDLSIENIVYIMCVDQMCDEKQCIVEVVVSLVLDNVLLFINIGIIIEVIVCVLFNYCNLKIIINNLYVVVIFSVKEDFEVLVVGGIVCSDGGIVGQVVVDFIQQFCVDFVLVGISGIDEDGSLFDFDYQEVCVFQVIIDNVW